MNFVNLCLIEILNPDRILRKNLLCRKDVRFVTDSKNSLRVPLRHRGEFVVAWSLLVSTPILHQFGGELHGEAWRYMLREAPGFLAPGGFVGIYGASWRYETGSGAPIPSFIYPYLSLVFSDLPGMPFSWQAPPCNGIYCSTGAGVKQ